jgi:hypothetical protein
MNWDDEDTGPAVAPRRNTFVAPAAPLALRPRVEVLPPSAHELQAAQPVTTVQELTTSHQDRARAFNLVSIPLALTMGFVALLAAVGLAGVPLLSWAALLWLFTVFAFVWAVAWVVYVFVSPDGGTVLQIVLGYKLLAREQRERHARMRQYQEDERVNRN